MMTRTEAIQMILAKHPDALVVASNGLTSREVAAVAPDRPTLLLLGAMGLAPAVGVGLAMARQDIEVVVIEGDGNALMSQRTPAGPLVERYILDNGLYETTGGQEVPREDLSQFGTVIQIKPGKLGAPRPPAPEVIIGRVREWLANKR